MSADAPPKLRFKELPDFLRKKIKFPVRQEKTACWHWIGEVKKAEQRHKLYPSRKDGGYRPGPNGRYGWERATPRATHPLTNKKTDAHRLVYSFARCIAVDDVPKLERCHDDTCVNPWHVREIGLTNAQRDRAQGLQQVSAVADEEYTPERCLELLRAANDGEGVSPWIEKDDAADEAGIPRDDLTDETWAQYVREEMEKEEADAA